MSKLHSKVKISMSKMNQNPLNEGDPEIQAHLRVFPLLYLQSGSFM